MVCATTAAQSGQALQRGLGAGVAGIEGKRVFQSLTRLGKLLRLRQADGKIVLRGGFLRL